MSDVETGNTPGPAEYVDLVNNRLIPAVRALDGRWRAHAETLGQPDEDLTSQADSLLSFVDEVETFGPTVLDPEDPTPVPDVPSDLPTDPSSPTG